MSYTIKLPESNQHYLVRVTAPVTIEIARQWSAELQQMSQATGIRRFLFDLRSAKNVCSVLENYQFAYRDAEDLSLQRNARTALLVSKDDGSHDFVELTLRNAGYGVKKFTEEASAVSWLEA